MRRSTALALVCVILAAAAAGCAGRGAAPEQPSVSLQSVSPAHSAVTSGGAVGAGSGEPENATYVFTDSAGREVQLPRNIERVAPTGALAQLVLFTLCPDKLVGLSSDFSGTQYEYIGREYAALPILGNLYSDTLNLETVMLAAPQVIIDIGETKPNANDDLDSLRERTGIPAIFIQMSMETILEAYRTLGEVTGETGQAQKLTDYIARTLSETKRKVDAIPYDDRVRVYYAQDDGLTAFVDGTVHSEVIGLAGGINVAIVEETVRGGASMISIEQVMLWDPEVVLFAPNSIYDTVEELAEWSGISAIRAGRFFEPPDGPYNWMGRPPSVNRVLGIKWLSKLLYPELFSYDLAAEAREFYRLFYHCEVTDAQIAKLLAGSTIQR